MGRYRLLAMLALLICAISSFATDYRLVVASDDPATRKAAAIVVFEATGKLNKEDRITSITFSAAADMKPNCLVSLDPASGKSALAMSPDVQIYQGKVMIAGAKPTKKVIPAHLAVDTPVVAPKKESVMQPIINQVNNLPWVYIAVGVGLFMFVMFVMNRRSQQFTTSMSKEAKNLYLETVGRITERLDQIEQSQERLVKNPPVVRTFRAQIDDFEGRLGRIEKLAKEGKDEMGRAAAELGQADKRHTDLVGKIESARTEAAKTQATLKEEAEALRSELKLMLSSQDAAASKLETLAELKVSALQIAEQNRGLEAKLAAQEELRAKVQAEQMQQLQAVQNELATLRANQESLLSMPSQLETVSASLSNMPAEFESLRTSYPRLDGIEARLDSMPDYAPRFEELSNRFDGLPRYDEKFDQLSEKLETLPEMRDSLNELPAKFPRHDDELSRIHDSILKQIEESEAHLGELLSAHSFVAPAEQVEAKVDEAPVVETKKQKKGKAAKHEEPEAELEEAQPEAVLEVEEPQAELVGPMSEVAEESLPEATMEVVEEPVAELPEEMEPEALLEAEPVAEESVELVAESVEEAEVEAISEDLMAEEALLEEVAPEAVEESLPTEDLLIEESEAEAPAMEEVVEEPEAMEIVAAPAVESETEAEVAVEVEEPSAVAEEPVATEEPSLVPESNQLTYRYHEPDEPVFKEFHFNNAIKKMAEEEKPLEIKEDTHRAGTEAPVTFHLEALPDHLETFEDNDPIATLPTFHMVSNEQPLDDVSANKEAELVLQGLDQPKSAAEDMAAFDSDNEEEGDAHMGHWTGLGGSSSRSWGSDSSRPLELRSFEGELKPLTPIETAPIGDMIGGMVYGFGRVVYACGKNVHGFWPGREDRHTPMDQVMPTDDWRMALRGQNLFVAEEKKVKIVSVQGWFVLEQFSGEYQDQLITETRWVGLRHDALPTLDFRDFRGQMAGQTTLDMDQEGLKLCAIGKKVYAGSRDGRIVEATEFGSEQVGQGPEGGELLHLTCDDSGPIAIFRNGSSIECWTFHGTPKSASFEVENYAGWPVLLGGKMYLADLDKSELVCINLKKMQRSSVPAFAGVSALRRVIGVQHKSQHDLFAITTDGGKKGGRLVMVNAKTGAETTFGSVGQANVNLICADHHLVLSTSSQYQNVIRVLEPFAERIAA